VLFADRKVDMRWPFSNWNILAQVVHILKVVLWGKAALEHEGIAKHAGPKTNSTNWLVDVDSAGCITWAAQWYVDLSLRLLSGMTFTKFC
ncbi:hypothetical protein PAXRUDRAFT_167599, partial [Paxillus rubicundulus Ve08.2h10]